MKLHEFFTEVVADGYYDFDVWDGTMDMCVTISLPDAIEDDNDYDNFLVELPKHVELVSKGYADSCEITADWYGMIEKNEPILRAWTEKNWYKGNHKDFDDYAEEWIKELHHWCAGYLPEDMYHDVCELIKKLK